jgi:hypothetical protein
LVPKNGCHNISKIFVENWVIIKHPLAKSRVRKPKGKSEMDNLEKLATLGTQDNGRRQGKQNKKHHTEN